MDVQRFFAVRDTYSHAKLAAVLGATVVYVAAALMLRPIVGGSVLMAVAVPALLAAWSFGARAGLLAVLLGFLLNLLLVTAFVEEGFVWWLVHGGALSTVTLAGVALAVGHLRDVRARLESELPERRRLQRVGWPRDERLAAAPGSPRPRCINCDVPVSAPPIPAASRLGGPGTNFVGWPIAG